MSGACSAKCGQDAWLGDDGGYLMPKDGPIARSLRKHFAHLVRRFGTKDLIPLYIDQGVFVFDMYVPTSTTSSAQPTTPVQLAPLSEDEQATSSRQVFQRQADQQP